MVCDLGIPVYLSRMLVEDNYRFFSCYQICTKEAAGAKTTTLAEVCREERGGCYFFVCLWWNFHVTIILAHVMYRQECKERFATFTSES